MTIGTAGNRVSLNCDGATKVFPVNLQAYLAGDFTVILTAPAAAGGGQTTLTLNSDYSLVASSTDAPPKWTLTTLAATAYLAGYSLQAFVNAAQVQQTSYVQGQAFPSLAVQTNLDRLTQMVQRIEDQVSRAVRAPDGDVNPLLLLPPAGQRAFMNLTTDASGNITLSQALAAGVLSAASIGAFLYPQTAAETAAGVAPTFFFYPEGDIRRYGALVANADNSGAINKALTVSGAGGNAAFIPGGTWKTTSTVVAAPLSSMYGVGNASIINPAAGFDGMSFAADTSSYAIVGTARFFREFQIVGTLTGGTNTNSGIVINYTVASGFQVTGVNFSTIWISNFKFGVFMRQLKNSDFYGIFMFNVFNGFFFNGQVITTSFTDCNIERGTITGAGNACGYSFQTVAAESVENTHVRGGQVYNFDIGVNVALAFELQLEHMDISQSQITGVSIGSTNGGFWLRDCWIEMTNASAVTGVQVGAITPSVSGNVNIINNYINNDTPFAGSQGINVGNSNVGCIITENKVIGFDQGITLGASAGQICRDNKINCVTSVYSATSYAINYTSTLAPDNVCGPNYIAPGTAQSATMANASANIGVTSSAAFPVGTPVTFSNAVNGFFANTTYYVLTSAANVITVATAPGGAAIVATGATAINVSPAPLPLTTVAGIPAPGFQFFARGTFIGTYTGMTATVQGPIDWMACGYTVTMNVRNTFPTGTSNATTMTITGLPSFLAPITTQVFPANVIDSGVGTLGSASINSAGLFSFFKTFAAGAFTNTGTKGVNTLPMTYTLT